MSKPDKNTYSKHTIDISMFLCDKMTFIRTFHAFVYACFTGGLNIYKYNKTGSILKIEPFFYDFFHCFYNSISQSLELLDSLVRSGSGSLTKLSIDSSIPTFFSICFASSG